MSPSTTKIELHGDEGNDRIFKVPDYWQCPMCGGTFDPEIVDVILDRRDFHNFRKPKLNPTLSEFEAAWKLTKIKGYLPFRKNKTIAKDFLR